MADASVRWTANVERAIKSFLHYIVGVAQNSGQKITLAEIRESTFGVENERLDRAMKTFVEELEEIGFQKGREEGRAEGVVALTLRNLNRRFGKIPPELVRQIEAINDYPSLEKIADFVLDAKNLTEYRRLVGSFDGK